MNIGRKEYIERLLSKGYRQIDEDTFELHGIVFILHEEMTVRRGMASVDLWLITEPHTSRTFRVCISCPELYACELDTGRGEFGYVCGVSGRFIGDREDVEKELCDQEQERMESYV